MASSKDTAASSKPNPSPKAAPASASGSPPAERSRTPRAALLFVDDEQEILDSLYDLFRLEYDVHRARSGEEGLRLLEEREFSVVMVDQRMPDLSGTELLARVRERFPDTVRLLFTGYADLPAVIAAINEGHVYRYIAKPWDPEELRLVIAQACERHRLTREHRELLRTLAERNEELRQAVSEREAAANLARSRAELLAGIAHDLRNPLTVLLGYSATLIAGTFGPLTERQAEAVERLQGGARSMGRLINDSLDLVKVESGRDSLYPTEFAVADVAAEILPSIQEAAERKRIQFAAHIPPEIRVEADQIKVGRILLNLLNNAVKFTRADGRITLTAAADDAWLTLTVADTGIGIPLEAQEQIFEQFVVLTDGSGHREIGTGLGLAVCKRLVDLHGGSIDVRSEPEQGSVFRVRLPLRQAAPDA